MSKTDKPTFDFSNGVRGKHASEMENGYTMTVHHPDGTQTVQIVKPRPNTVILDQDVAAVFSDSEQVNKVLRGLIESLPQLAAS